MKKNIFLWVPLLLFLYSAGLCYGSFSISGLNEAQYLYKAAEDSLSSYFYNETALKLNYNNFEAGISFIAEYPKYSQFDAIKDLHYRDLDYRWDERYLQINMSGFRLRAGSFSEFFGNGIMLRSYRDKTYDHDTRLTGLNIRMNIADIDLKGFYASLPNEDRSDRKDTAAGLDFSRTIFGNSKLGFSFTSQQIRRIDDRYSTRIAAGSRLEIIGDGFDISSEYAESKSYRRIGDDIKGQAIYGLANSYFGPFTFSAGYKKYDRFDDRLNDLPTLNASEEPLSDRLQPGYDEEGLLGQIRYFPLFHTELAVTYSEAWNSNFRIRQSDLLLEGRRDFDTLILGLEYAQLESIDKERKIWLKEITPAFLFDFNISRIPVHLRTELGYQEKVIDEKESDFYKPLVQLDLFLNKISFSLITEFELEDLGDLQSHQKWIGLEVSAPVFSHSDLKLFIGEERGGKVCRSGICYYTTPFKGLRLDFTTRF